MAKVGEKCLSVRVCQGLGSLSRCLGIHPCLGKSPPSPSPPPFFLTISFQIFPVSLLCALASLTNIAGFIKPLQTFLSNNPKAASALTSLAPVILVALLTLAICPILLVIANKAEMIITRLGVHNSVLERFWKFCKLILGPPLLGPNDCGRG